MGYIFALTAIFSENAGKILDKYNFKHTKVTPREQLDWVFGVMATVIAAFILILQPELPKLSQAALLPLGLIIGLSFLSNIFDEISLKINELSLREPLSNFHPILAGFIGYILFPEERTFLLLVALILSGMIILWGVKPNKLAGAQKIGIAYMFLSVIIESALSNIYVLALENVSPEYIALTRAVFIFILLLIFFKPKRNKKHENKKKSILYALAAGIAYSVGAIVSLYAIDTLGIVTAMLLLLFAPILRYASTYILLKDKPSKEEIISSCLLGLIALSVIFI